MSEIDEVLDDIARAICDSEAFMWLMVGANHPDAHLMALRGAWKAYSEAGGGYPSSTQGKRRSHSETCCQRGEGTVDDELACDAECWCHVEPHVSTDLPESTAPPPRECNCKERQAKWDRGETAPACPIHGPALVLDDTLWPVKFDDEIEEPTYDPRAAGTLYPTDTVKPIESGAQEYKGVILRSSVMGTLVVDMCKGCGVLVGDTEQHDYSHTKGRSQV
jgi:hypothetical protein